MAYLGKTPSQAVRSRYYFTATGGETSLSGADDNSNTLTFTDGNYVDVYLNGVLLVAATDYNTTTANTIAGLSALTASDVVEVVVYDTFSVFSGNVTGDFTVGGAFTSQGIDDNATSTAVTLDSSGNLLVAKTSANTVDQGVVLRNNGEVYATQDGDKCLVLNRKTSDGQIASFRKDNTEVGSIGNTGTEFYIGTPSGSDGYIRFQSLGIVPCTSTGANSDGTMQLGTASGRFKDLYLSGGVQNLGGASRTVSILGTDSGSNTRGIVVGDGKVYPNADASLQLGQSANRYTDLYLSGTAYVDTSIGIGTTSPGGELHLYRNSTGPCRLLLQNTEDISYIYSDGGQLIFDSDNGHLFRNENGTTEFGRFDSSGNLLVGTTDVTIGYSDGDVGFAVDGANGYFGVARSPSANNQALAYLNRLNSDGDIAQFRKDGSTVGSIGVDYGDRLYIGTGNTGLFFNNTSGDIQPTSTSTGLLDATIDLGSSGSRFKDLYLSGGVYLGGSGSANKLDDYEEGTWTPTVSRISTAPSVTYANRTGGYIKVGRLIYASFDVTASSVSGGSGAAVITGLPYNVTSSSYFAGYSVVQWRDSGLVPASGASTQLRGFAQRGAAYIYLQYDNSGSSGFLTNSGVTSWNSSGRLTGYVIYATN
jgi:hypothetical protein